jgi:hypothetical protein
LAAAADVDRIVTVESAELTIVGVRTGDPIAYEAHNVAFDANSSEIGVELQPNQFVSGNSTTDGLSGVLGPVVYLLRQGWIAWMCVILAPWLLLSFMPRTERWRRLARFGTVFASAALLVGSTMQYTTGSADRIGFALFCIGMPLLTLAATREARTAEPDGRGITFAAIFGAGAALVVAGLVLSDEQSSPLYAVGALVLGTFAGGAAMWCLAGRSAVLPGAAVALAVMAVTLGIPKIDSLWGVSSASLQYPALDTIGRMAVGVVWLVMLAIPLVLRHALRRAAWWTAAALLAGALLLVAPIRLITDPGSVYAADATLSVVWQNMATQALILANQVLLVTLTVLLIRLGNHRASLHDRGVVLVAITLVVCLAADPEPFSWNDSAAVAALAAGLIWLTPARNVVTQVSAAAHALLIRAELRRRLIRTVAADVYRGARSRLTDRSDTLEGYDQFQVRLDEAVSTGRTLVEGVPVGRAFTTDAGQTPLANALAAFAFTAPMSALLVGYEIVAISQQHTRPIEDLNLLNLAALAVHLLRWPAYSAFFGFCYPLLRGGGPLHKAINLAAIVLANELLPILSNASTRSIGVAFIDTSASAKQIAIAALIRTGQVLLFFVILGLLWERRLAMLADVGWNRLRDLRRATTLAAPVGTLLLAIATALGTALAGAAAAALISRPSTVPPVSPHPGVSVSSTP